MLHDVGQGQFWRDRQEHMHVIPSQHAFHDMDAQFGASLHDNLAYPLSHKTLQNLVSIFSDPHDVEPVVKSRVRG